ncbi:MAG: addiction module antidote protein, HigA family [Alphaproteobacteria bacterium 41-28]|nr:MAG: addiction module antidote protein, HigA family [Alphaproteobacteria bacterium 41-28]
MKKNWSIHPGEVLREEFLKPLGLTSYRLAKDIHVPVPRIHDIILEKRGITADTALRLSKYLGTTVQFWMNLQDDYEMYRALATAKEAIESIQMFKENSNDKLSR